MHIDGTDLPSEFCPLSCSTSRAAGVAFTSDGLRILLLPRLFQPNVCGCWAQDCSHQALCKTELSQFFDCLSSLMISLSLLTTQNLDWLGPRRTPPSDVAGACNQQRSRLCWSLKLIIHVKPWWRLVDFTRLGGGATRVDKPERSGVGFVWFDVCSLSLLETSPWRLKGTDQDWLVLILIEITIHSNSYLTPTEWGGRNFLSTLKLN